MTNDTIVIHKNRHWGFWALVLCALGLPVSALFLYLGFRPGRPGLGWALAAFGLLGLVAFAGYGWMVIRTLRSPWRLELTRSHLALYTPAYDLGVPWEHVAGIAVDEVDRRLGCALVFEDPAAVAEGAVFRRTQAPRGAVTSAARMLARMEGTFRQRGYHLGIPGRILELAPEPLAALLARARTGELWQDGREWNPALQGEASPEQEARP
jgi:hypothetical protein